MLTVGVVLAVAVIVAVALLDALGGSSGVEGRNQTSVSTSGETIAPSLPTSTFPPALRSWKGVVHRTIRLDRRIGVAWEETRQFESGAHTLRVRIELPRNAEVGGLVRIDQRSENRRSRLRGPERRPRLHEAFGSGRMRPRSRTSRC
jgi:hypothetical protein